MDRANLLTLPSTAWEAQYLEDASPLGVLLEQYDREHLPLLRYLSFLGIDSETAQEIVQDCFVKLQEHLHANGDKSHLRAWLYRVAHNLARNTQLSARSRRTERLADVTLTADPVAKEPTAEEGMLAEERVRILRQGLNQLSAAQREALVLRSQGLKYREISEALGLSVSTVAENVQRGLEKLKQLI